MERRKFTREFKLEAVRLIKDRAFRMLRLRRTWTCMCRSCAIG
jgi:transposase-like protein